MRKTIAITGASGFIGKALVEELLKKGANVIALSRLDPILPKFSNCEYRYFDLQMSDYSNSFQGADIVVHLAWDLTPGKGITSKSFNTNMKATDKIIATCKELSILKIIFVSSTSASLKSESSYSLAKYHAEVQFRSAGAHIIKPGLVIGEGGLFRKISNFVKTYRIVPIISRDKSLISTIDLKQLVSIISDCCESTSNRSQIIFAQGTNFFLEELFDAISSYYKIRIFKVPLPLCLLNFSLFLFEKLFPKAGISRQNLQGLLSSNTKSEAHSLNTTLE